jgi:hypothetical protein
MKTKLILSIAILLFTKNIITAQASWMFSIWFTLKDKSGKVIDKEQYQKEGIKLLSAPFGVHNDSYFIYDTLVKKMKFSQHTAVGISILVFIHKKDTTIVEISAKNLNLSEITLKNNTYNLRIWGFEDNFTFENSISGYKNTLVCENKKPFAFYIVKKRTRINSSKFLKHLIEVKLE